jgi:hypothetical protein
MKNVVKCSRFECANWTQRSQNEKLKSIFYYFWFSWPPVSLSNTYLRGLRGKATIIYGINFFEPLAFLFQLQFKRLQKMCFRNAKKNNYQMKKGC